MEGVRRRINDAKSSLKAVRSWYKTTCSSNTALLVHRSLIAVDQHPLSRSPIIGKKPLSALSTFPFTASTQGPFQEFDLMDSFQGWEYARFASGEKVANSGKVDLASSGKAEGTALLHQETPDLACVLSPRKESSFVIDGVVGSDVAVKDGIVDLPGYVGYVAALAQDENGAYHTLTAMVTTNKQYFGDADFILALDYAWEQPGEQFFSFSRTGARRVLASSNAPTGSISSSSKLFFRQWGFYKGCRLRVERQNNEIVAKATGVNNPQGNFVATLTLDMGGDEELRNLFAGPKQFGLCAHAQKRARFAFPKESMRHAHPIPTHDGVQGGPQIGSWQSQGNPPLLIPTHFIWPVETKGKSQFAVPVQNALDAAVQENVLPGNDTAWRNWWQKVYMNPSQDPGFLPLQETDLSISMVAVWDTSSLIGRLGRTHVMPLFKPAGRAVGEGHPNITDSDKVLFMAYARPVDGGSPTLISAFYAYPFFWDTKARRETPAVYYAKEVPSKDDIELQVYIAGKRRVIESIDSVTLHDDAVSMPVFRGNELAMSRCINR